ncbi:fimbrial usher protein [Citrobacter koseri]|uniref:Fimbrial usher protein n=1 Tax=Citrobacter koseri TaxID=545 RepID=A0A078LNF4_CITKO|nr:fimbrial usher protein [Citrobacter koseri]
MNKKKQICCASTIISPLACLIMGLSPLSGFAEGEAEFDVSFMQSRNGVPTIDVSRFARGNPIPAGQYNADIWLNGDWKGRADLRFADSENSSVAELCFTPALLSILDLQPEALKENPNEDGCISFKRAVPDAHIRFDISTLRLDVEIAQALIATRPRGWISPSRWETGVPAAFVEYDVNNYRYRSSDNDTTQTWLGLRAGFSAGGWAFRHRGSRNYGDGDNGGYDSVETNLRHDIAMLRGQLTLGDFSTDGVLMESVSMRGARLASDERMLPGALRGYAPVVRGMADSNARVVVRQNGNILYETTVPAGPFTIRDLYPTGYGGDLEVTVTESGGQTRTFTVPFASVAQLVRPGYTRYQVSAGRFRYGGDTWNDTVFQGTLQYGLTNDVTLNSGLSITPHYTAGLAGAAFNTPIGAVASDVTMARTTFINSRETKQGYSLHASYSVRVPESSTNLNLAAYRYSSKNFFSLKDALRANNSDAIDDRSIRYVYGRPKNQIQLSVNQELAQGYGSLYLTGSSYRYWDRQGSQNEYQAGYSNNWGRVNYQLGYSRSKDNEIGRTDDRIYLNFSMPWSDNFQSPQLSATLNHNKGGPDSAQTTVSGVAGSDNQFNWGITGNTQEKGPSGWSLNTAYRTPFTQLQATAGRDSDKNRQMSLGASGAIVAHPYGVTLSNDLSDTFTIVHAQGASGAVVNNAIGNRLDHWGNGIVPYVTPYEKNRISIDPAMLPADIELSATEQEVIPRANSATLVSFTTKIGASMLFDITMNDGEHPPMAAEALDDQGKSIGWVGQGGRLFARGLPERGRVQVVWGRATQEYCYFNYKLPAETATNRMLSAAQAVQCKRTIK